MDPEAHSFFSDPKTVLAIFALVVSIGTFLWSLANQSEQNRRWDVINSASVELSRQRFQPFRQIPRSEFTTTDWGYLTTLYGSEDSADRLEMINCLRARDAVTGQLIPNFSPVFTINEVSAESHRVGFKGEINIRKLYRPTFYLKNNGKTIATHCIISVDLRQPSGEWRVIYPPSQPQQIHPGQEVNAMIEWELPLQETLPEKLPFRVNVSYQDVNGRSHKRETYITWTSALNYWVYEP